MIIVNYIRFYCKTSSASLLSILVCYINGCGYGLDRQVNKWSLILVMISLRIFGKLSLKQLSVCVNSSYHSDIYN